MHSTPPFRIPVPCGDSGDVRSGREPLQLGWYEWIAHQEAGRSVLDVGAGMCEGLKVLGRRCRAAGLDNDPRLHGLDPALLIGCVSALPDGCFDVVVAVDVIEHVVEDLWFLEHLLRLARERVYVTTPNAGHSHCWNAHHAREYTPEQLLYSLRAQVLCGGSSDGYGDHPVLRGRREAAQFPHLCGIWSPGGRESTIALEQAFNTADRHALAWSCSDPGVEQPRPTYLYDPGVTRSRWAELSPGYPVNMVYDTGPWPDPE